MCIDFPISSLSMITPVIYYVLACQYILLETPEHLAAKKLVQKAHTQEERERERDRGRERERERER